MSVLSMSAQCIECPPSCWEVRGSIPVGDSDFFSSLSQVCSHLITELKINHLYSLIIKNNIAVNSYLNSGCKKIY